MKLLLHCCCAPCSVSAVKSLREEEIEPELFWYNPNIHPCLEYNERRDCLKNFAEDENLELINLKEKFGLRFFLNEVSRDLDRRCEKCYLMRLEKTASFAAGNGYDKFSTTLLISPYQNHEAIKRIAEEAAVKYKIEFLYRDFRPLFREGQSRAREKNFYMQKYCGCVFSEEERYFRSNTRQDTENAKKAKKENNTSLPILSASFASSPNRWFEVCEERFNRISLLIGDKGLEKLKDSNVLVFGAGGVGSWAAEALVRSGIGKIGIIDNDVICASNINRQIEATSLTLGQTKASALKKRLLEINPECEITAWDELFTRENAAVFGIETADYVIDAIDTMNHKLDLIEIVCKTKAKLFSSMGMALKLNPLKIKMASIWKTDVCPLARLVRQGLRKRMFTGDFTVVYSDENVREQIQTEEENNTYIPGQKRINGSIVTITASAGFLLASLVINDILSI
jgi:tRNA A37 threonylcarbamoyladenosine dehydratase